MNWVEILKKLKEQRAALMASIDGAETKDALDKIEMDLRKVDIKIKEAEEKVEEERSATEAAAAEAARTAAVNNGQPVGTQQRSFSPIAGANLQQQQQRSAD